MGYRLEACAPDGADEVPAAAEEFDAIGGNRPGGIGRRAVAAIGDVDEYAALHRFYYLSQHFSFGGDAFKQDTVV